MISGDVGIDHLVVRHAGSERIGEGHIAAAIGVNQPGDSEDGVLAKDGGVDEVIVDAAIDHVDLHQAVGGAHEYHPVENDQVTALHDLDSHFAGEEGVLEVSAVVDPRGEEHADGVGFFARCHALQGLTQEAGVGTDRPHIGFAIEARKGPFHDLPILQDIGDPRGAAEVVFQDDIAAVLVANQVGATDVDVDIPGNIEALQLRAIVHRGLDDMRRNDSIRHDLGMVIDVVEKEIEGRDALNEAPLDGLPFMSRNDAGKEIEGERCARCPGHHCKP